MLDSKLGDMKREECSKSDVERMLKQYNNMFNLANWKRKAENKKLWK